jgi:hypothetical protein
MFSRIALLIVTLFWLTMNYLLWRSEFGGGRQSGSPVPVETVWRKILTAPDSSSLEIFHLGRKVGSCRWTAMAGHDQPGKKTALEGGPEGWNTGGGYRLTLNGNLTLEDARERLYFDGELDLQNDRAWRETKARFGTRDNSVTVRAVAAEQKLSFWMGNENENSARVITFAELRNPRELARKFDLPAPLGLMGLADLTAPDSAKSASWTLGLNWDSRTDWMVIGHSQVRAYHLQAVLFDRYRIIVMVSPVGEILRVELPDDWTLVNESVAIL